MNLAWTNKNDLIIFDEIRKSVMNSLDNLQRNDLEI